MSAAPTPPRNPTAPGRPYPAEIVAGVRGLVVAGVSYREAAARAGLSVDTVGAWARRFGWRGNVSAIRDASDCLPPRGEGDPERSGGSDGGRAVSLTVVGCGTPPTPGPSPQGGGEARTTTALPRPHRYPPALREAARARVEGSRDGMERIAREFGIERGTLYRWAKRFGWVRPSAPAKKGPDFFRKRRLGRPYAADAVGTARDLVTRSKLPAARIAARAGISRATLYRWMTRPGFTRQELPKGARPYRAPYPPEVVAAAHELYRTTMLPTSIIAARAKTTRERVRHWARTGSWTRPSDLPFPDGRVRRGRTRRMSSTASC